MRLRWIVNSLMMILVFGGLFLDVSSLQTVTANSGEKVENSLVEKLTAQGQADFIVRFTEQPDLSAAYEMNWAERGEYVVSLLQEAADHSQGRAKGLLDSAGMKYQTFFAGNELYVWQGNLDAAGKLAGLPEVESIRETRTYSIKPIESNPNPFSIVKWPGDLLASNLVSGVGEATTAALTWGLDATNANDFWAKFGFQGEGIIVANIDTGVQWNHPGLDQAFRCGTNPSDPKCWYDPTGICGGKACDNHGHGTHTMGTMVSDDDPTLPYTAGMAPGAKWIACKGCVSSDCSDYTLSSCADWILAPGGSSANRPHIVNNSWGGEGGNTWFESKVQAWRAAGIFPSFPSGNDGDGCSTIDSPGDYQISFASAAQVFYTWYAASFSSRGPSEFGHDPYTKPNITAPGAEIWSTIPTDSWGRSSGTSMAAPHSSGAVALLWSCNPGLIGQVDTTIQALQKTAWLRYAGNCSYPPDLQGNYTYGYGYLDVLAAGINYCSSVATGTLNGYVYDSISGDPIEGALVNITSLLAEAGTQTTTITDPSGFYKLTIPVGIYEVTVSMNGYASQTLPVEIFLGRIVQQDFHLDWIGEWMSGPADPTDFWRYDCTWFDDGTGLSAYNLKVYCMGGRTSGTLPDETTTESSAIWRFDAATQLFTDTGDELIEDVSNYTANTIQDAGGWAIYVIGGYDADNTIPQNVNYIQRYDPATGSVQKLTTDLLPLKIGGVQANPGACVGVQNKIYCFGGFVSGTTPYVSVETWEYDPNRAAGTRWDRIESADLSVGRGYIQAAVQGDKIYAMGGLSGKDIDYITTDAVEVLNVNDLASGWKTLAPLPLPTAGGRGFGFGGDTKVSSTIGWDDKVFVVGGGVWPYETNLVFEYDSATMTWIDDFPVLLAARRNHAGVFVPLCTEDPADGLPGMWVLGGRKDTDDPPYQEPEFYPMPCSDPTPLVSLTKTVGLEPDVCATTKRIDIDQETEVTYCFTLYNNSPITMAVHDLVDSHLGTVLNGYQYSLLPGASISFTETITVNSTTFNLAGWTAYDSSGNSYQAYDYASVVFKDKYYFRILPVNYKEY